MSSVKTITEDNAQAFKGGGGTGNGNGYPPPFGEEGSIASWLWNLLFGHNGSCNSNDD